MSQGRSAREVLARIRRGKAANATSEQAASLRSRVLELRARSVAEIRSAAVAQLERAKQAFAAATGVDWYAGLAVRFANHARWQAFRVNLDSATDSIAKGDADATEDGKRTRYVSAWLDAGTAAREIEGEASIGRTDMTMVLSEGASKAMEEIAGFDWSPAFWLVGGLVAFEVLRR